METLHHALPIFSQPITLAVPLCSQDLLLTICILMAKLTKFSLASVGNAELDAQIQLLLSSTSVYEECLGLLSLDEMRKACLISFYEFHQFPGHQAWEKVGKLVRAAYWMGLDRLDDPDRPAVSQQKAGHNWDGFTLRDEDRDDWRMLWWCIYRLDSYANFAAGTPYMVHEDLAATELLRNPQHARCLFLHSELDKLRQLVSPIAEASDSTKLFNLHLVTIATMRSVKRGFQQRVGSRRQTDNVNIEKSASIERQLNALRLTLPANYQNPMRNALAGESKLDHHSRLVTVLHLHMARLIIAIFHCGCRGIGDEWPLKWQQVLESAQDVALIAEQWDNTFCLCVDPAISYIFFTAVVFVHFHNKSSLPRNVSQNELHHLETVLLLQLEQFANIWMLPRLLIREC